MFVAEQNSFPRKLLQEVWSKPPYRTWGTKTRRTHSVPRPYMLVAPHKSRKLRRGQFSFSFIAFSGKIEGNVWFGKAIKFKFCQSCSDKTQVFQTLKFAIEVKFMCPRRKRNFPFLQKLDFSVSFPS